MEWMRASMELVAKTDRAGSSAARGPAQPCRRTCRGAQTLLGVQEMRARMERLVTSLPVPQVVATRMSSFPFSRGILPSYRSRMGVTVFEAKHLGDVHHGAAADGDDPGDVLGHVVVDGDHFVEGSPAPYFSWKMVGQGRFRGPEVGVVDVFVGQDQVLGPSSKPGPALRRCHRSEWWA